jgi:hypothetical protein
MKSLIFTLSMALLGLSSAQEAAPDSVALIPVSKLRVPAPLFFSVDAKSIVTVAADHADYAITAAFKIHQGRPETLTLGLVGEGEIIAVEGDGLKNWTVRKEADGSRFLDFKPDAPEEGGTFPDHYTFRIAARHDLGGDAGTAAFDVLLPAPGAAVGFAGETELRHEGDAIPRVMEATGLLALKGNDETARFGGSGKLTVRVEMKGAAARPIELTGATLEGTPSSDGSSMSFILRGKVEVKEAGKGIDLLEKGALSGEASGDGWFVRLRKTDDGYVHELVGERAGSFAIVLPFEVPVTKKGDWKMVDFTLPAGVVVPVNLAALGGDVSFDKEQAVVPERQGERWTGFLPSSGTAAFSWKDGRKEEAGALFFTSSEIAEVKVGAGLARRRSVISFRVLQGKLDSLPIEVAGAGEILAVKGAQVLGWSVREDAGKRLLDIRLSRPVTSDGQIEIEAQTAMGAFPVKLGALRFSPQGTLRHSGFLRVSNDGAVKLEVTGATGLMQLSPGQFPGARDGENLRQSFVYRFPSADHDYGISADQVLPEVSVVETTVHELAESDRRLSTDLELDIREAPLREWMLKIPADFAVAGVTGADVADFTVSTTEAGGQRELKVLFKQAVIGRHLVTVQLEKNLVAQPGDWSLPVLSFPGVKSARGYVGVVAGAGYRIALAKSEGLAEVPQDYFPKKLPGLQQAFRIRESQWSATVKVEALGRSVQADVFHLYSLKEGAVSGSVLVNYFVVGAPAAEWRLRVPQTLGNVEVTGQNVGRDWRREGDILIVPLAHPVLGAATLLVTFEHAMSARGGEISPGEVRPLDVQSERGNIQVVSPLQVKYEITRSEGPVLKLEASELPAEYRLLSTAPTLAAWQYTSGAMSIGLKIEWFQAGETVGQFVDFARLSSHVSRDGQVVTEAHFFVKSRGLSALRLRLPEGSKLWESKVDGTTVSARGDGTETLVPLPAKTDPNDPVEVTLSYGSATGKASRVELAAPVLAVPLVISEWTVNGDKGRLLVPTGGNARAIAPVLTETGMEWISARAGMPAALILLGAAGGAFLYRLPRLRWVALILVVVTAAASFHLAARAVDERRVNLATVQLSAPVVSPEHEVTAVLKNVPSWGAMVSGWGVAAAVAGVALGGYGWLRSKGMLITGGLALLGIGLLSQHLGAVWFFGAFGCALLTKALPWGLRVWRDARKPVVLAATALLAFGLFVNRADGATAESAVQSWHIADGRLTGEIEIKARGKAEERYLLLRDPAVLTDFQGEGWRVVKAQLDDEDAYFLVATVDGPKSGKARFELPLKDPQQGWKMPTGPAAVQRVAVRWNQPGWEFISAVAAKISPVPDLAENESGAELVLGATDEVEIMARPKQRDAATEKNQFFTEISDLYLPGPGVVSGRHLVGIRPAQGVVKELTIEVPEGFTVGEVAGGPVGSWRFDPRSRELHISVEPAQEQPFSVIVGTQRGSSTLPMNLKLSPLKVRGASGTVGLLGIAFQDEAQPENVVEKGMSPVNLDDFPAQMLPVDSQRRPVAVLHRAFRHSGEDASVTLTIAPVAPEIRAETKQVLSLGEDRMVLSVDLTASITRAGIFRLGVEIPKGFEVESVTGASLGNWVESEEGGQRILSLHLQGRTLGEQAFALTLSAPATGAQTSWQVPRVAVQDAARQTGTLTVVPERGLQVRAVARTNASQLDPKEAGMPRPGVLSFRLLQSDWSLALAVGKLDPWVTAQVLHEVIARDGQTLAKMHVIYRIENASIKSTQIRLPGLDDNAAATVRASGPAVADFIPVPGQERVWELRFQRAMSGEVKVDIEYQQLGEDAIAVQPLVAEGVRQTSYFVALKTVGRLEIGTVDAPDGWQRSDWAVVPAALKAGGDLAAPASVFKVAEAEGPLGIHLKSHKAAESLRLRVTKGDLTTLVSQDGASVTSVDLAVQVAEKGRLRLTLPEDASLFNVLVNGDGVSLVKEGASWLFYVYPAPENDRPASVRFVYANAPRRQTVLEGPMLDVPLENLHWRVLLPQGWRLAGHSGDFDLTSQANGAAVEDYHSFVMKQRAAGKEQAVALLDQANAWLQTGDQDKAGKALSKAARNGLLDEASNEDARVQLRNLKTQQATLALNTRRQRMYLDNRAEVATGNAQLEKAAEENPLLQGNLNYDPHEFDRMLGGNSADENAAMKAIANRIVSQQLAADPAPAALDVTLGSRGSVADFTRSVQVDGGKPMKLELKLEPNQSGGWLYGLLIAVLGAVAVGRKI